MEELRWRIAFLGVKLENLRAFGHEKDLVEACIGELKIYSLKIVARTHFFEMSSHLASANLPPYGA